MLSGLAFAAASPKPAPVDQCAIHQDGGLVYDPLRREAVSTGQLKHYAKAPVRTERIKLGDFTLMLA